MGQNCFDKMFQVVCLEMSFLWNWDNTKSKEFVDANDHHFQKRTCSQFEKSKIRPSILIADATLEDRRSLNGSSELKVPTSGIVCII